MARTREAKAAIWGASRVRPDDMKKRKRIGSAMAPTMARVPSLSE